MAGKNPNEGTNGKLASNVTGEAITPNFGYEQLTDRDKKIVIEIIDFLREKEDLNPNTIEQLKLRFKIKEIPKKPIEGSEWHYFTKDFKLGQSIQGYRQVKENGKPFLVPHIAFSGDLDYLNDFIKKLVKKIKDMPTE